MNIFNYWFGLAAPTENLLASVQFSTEAWHKKVMTKLFNPEVAANEIVTVLSENPKLKNLYGKSAGVVEGYTVGQHTEMVLEIAQKYRAYFKSLIDEHVEWGEFLLFLSLHDIGKGVSKDADCIATHRSLSAKELELQMSRNILTETLELLRIRSRSGHIFQAMLMFDSQGDYLKGDIEADCFKNHLLDMSAVSGLTPSSFYQLYNVFHIIDAASYPNLQPLFVFGSESLRHCEGNQLTIDFLLNLLPFEAK